MSFADQFSRRGDSFGSSFNRPQPSGNNFQSVRANIQRIASNIAKIKQSVEKIGTSRDSQQLRDTINSLVRETKNLSKTIPQQLKQLEQTFSTDEFRRKDEKKNQKKLAQDFKFQMEAFQDVNSLVLQKEKKHPVPSTQSFMDHPSEPTYYEENQDEQRMMARNKQLHLEDDITFQEVVVEDRFKGIHEIEQNIQDVNEIMIDLSNLVSEQGVMIDNIESNVEKSVDYTTKATFELQKASNYQRKSRSKLCCLLLLILIIVAVGVLVTLFLTHAF